MFTFGFFLGFVFAVLLKLVFNWIASTPHALPTSEKKDSTKKDTTLYVVNVTKEPIARATIKIGKNGEEFDIFTDWYSYYGVWFRVDNGDRFDYKNLFSTLDSALTKQKAEAIRRRIIKEDLTV